VKTRLVLVLAAVAVGAAVGATALNQGSAANKAEPTAGDRAIAVFQALTRAETRYRAVHHRYTPRLADLFSDTREGANIAEPLTVPVDIALDVSANAQTVLIRVNVPSVSLFVPLVSGQAVGFGCELHARDGQPAGGCPRGP
jgi:hypothetical protein